MRTIAVVPVLSGSGWCAWAHPTCMIHYDGDDILLDCFLQPRASRDEIIGEHDGALKVRVKAPPVDGAANKQLVKFLAKQFGVGKSDVSIESGETSRRKRVRIKKPAKMPVQVENQL